MQSVTLHILVDTEDKEDVFRDIQISLNDNLLTLHQSILDAFNFSGIEMASFFSCDKDWEREQEYPQMAMDEKQGAFEMGANKVSTLFSKKGDKGLLVYDFMRMWCFLIEVINVENTSCEKPEVLLSVGNAPKEDSKEATDFSGNESFESDSFEDEDEFGFDSLDEENFDSYNDESYY